MIFSFGFSVIDEIFLKSHGYHDLSSVSGIPLPLLIQLCISENVDFYKPPDKPEFEIHSTNISPKWF